MDLNVTCYFLPIVCKSSYFPSILHDTCKKKAVLCSVCAEGVIHPMVLGVWRRDLFCRFPRFPALFRGAGSPRGPARAYRVRRPDQDGRTFVCRTGCGGRSGVAARRLFVGPDVSAGCAVPGVARCVGPGVAGGCTFPMLRRGLGMCVRIGVRGQLPALFCSFSASSWARDLDLVTSQTPAKTQRAAAPLVNPNVSSPMATVKSTATTGWT